jgi:lipopolysaccharide transport system ATP-binding protein
LALESISVEIIESIVILIYSSLGIRVAILDLRTKDFPLRINEANQLTISGRIRSLPLVEGDYSIGIYIQGNKTWGDFFDVMNLAVKPQPYDGDAVKYSPNVRGFIDLEYTLF